MAERKVGERRATKRRDDDPVRVAADHRVAYWTGGVPGLGRRRHRRFASAAEAQRFAVQLRIDLADERDLQGTIGRLIDDYLDTIEGSVPTNTFSKYESTLGNWVRPAIGDVFTHQFGIASLTRCFEAANSTRCGPSVIQAIDTVVGAVVSYGADRGDFGGREPLPPSRRRSVKRRYASLAAAMADLGWPPRTRNHALRHHFACYSLAPPPVGHGIDLGKLSELLGHATPEYTARIYIHSLSAQVNWQR